MSKKTAVILLLCSALLIAAGVAVGVQRGWGWSTAQDELAALGDYDPGALTAIRVEGLNMDVRVYDWDGELSADVSESLRSSVTARVQGGVLTVTQQERRTLWRPAPEGYLILWVPGNYTGSLSVTTASGDVTLSGLRTETTAAALTTASGEVSVYDGVLASLTAETVSGDVYASGISVRGDAAVSTVSGEIDLWESAAENVSLQTVSGDVWAYGLECGALRVESVSGDAYFDGNDAGSISVQTLSGDVYGLDGE